MLQHVTVTKRRAKSTRATEGGRQRNATAHATTPQVHGVHCFVRSATSEGDNRFNFSLVGFLILNQVNLVPTWKPTYLQAYLVGSANQAASTHQNRLHMLTSKLYIQSERSRGESSQIICFPRQGTLPQSREQRQTPASKSARLPSSPHSSRCYDHPPRFWQAARM
jgi:hypothetical protein